MKSGYADHSEEVLEKYPNRKYYGNPVYHNLRYRFQYRNQLYMGLTAEKMPESLSFVNTIKRI